MCTKKLISFSICLGIAFSMNTVLVADATRTTVKPQIGWKILIDSIALPSGQTLRQFYNGRKYVTMIISTDGLSREIYRSYCHKEGIEYSLQTRDNAFKEYWKETFGIGIFGETINLRGIKEINGHQWAAFKFTHTNDRVILSEIDGTNSIINYMKIGGKFLPESIKFDKACPKDMLPIASSFAIEKIIFILSNRNGSLFEKLLEGHFTIAK